ncbi:MAG: Cobalt-zinc-cadmium resistance protein CzcA [Polyangiaceae bacterium]|nr:Cobalt-zinc-cadmium resistance protein CzcA [Polyangiaceae bacterium]
MLGILLASGVYAAKALPIDALPDISTVQVTVLTTAAGLDPETVEGTVTTPLENAVNGIPGVTELRSTSRAGVSAVTLVFKDGTDVWFARQLVAERLRTVSADLPSNASPPEIAPVFTGLGQVYQFVVRSPVHSPMQLRTMLDWEIVPKLRGIPGVSDINTMGGELKQFHVVVSNERLRAHSLSLTDVVDALRAANMSVGGGYVNRNDEAFSVRGTGFLRDIDDIKRVVIRTSAASTPVFVGNVSEVTVGPALPYGTVTKGGSDAVAGTVMMLMGSNSRDVVKAVALRVAEISKTLPAGVKIEPYYDRAEFVGSTISTVMLNLAEGVAIVLVVLALFLGSLRGAIAVVVGVPASMSVALIGMHWFKVPGDLMSLGAIDFGFLVDGPIVLLESVIAATAAKQLVGDARADAYAKAAAGVVRPVAFAVAIIMLVYLPLLTLEGAEGKMFRPMAITMACALFGALVYAVLFFPAMLVTLVPVPKDHGPHWIEAIGHAYTRFLPSMLRFRFVWLAGAVGMLVVMSVLFLRSGAEFVPRIFEGDLVVAIRRAPSIALPTARDLDLKAHEVLRKIPEVTSTVAMTGRAEVALDTVGNDNTDILVKLRPKKEWRSSLDFDGLSGLVKNMVETEVPGTFVSVSQPIEDKTNEILSGSRADVQVQVFGPDLEGLTRITSDIGRIVSGIQGTGDIRVERAFGQPAITVVPDRGKMARYGVRVEDAFAAIQASREGIEVGNLYDGPRRFALRVIYPPATPTVSAISELFVNSRTGALVPLGSIADLSEGDGVASVRHKNRERALRVDVNLRGRDLVSWVAEAQQAIAKRVNAPSGYRIEWGGQFENFERASARLKVVVPVVVLIILGMLFTMFQNLRATFAVMALVPLSLTGGMIGLLLRGMPFSLPAAVGFIALGGIGVLNGVVMASEVRKLLDDGVPIKEAIIRGCSSVCRAVLTTTAVAALGFLPMMLATGAGAEVQQPLATVVVAGMGFGTVLTLCILPGILTLIEGRRSSRPALQSAAVPVPAEGAAE